MGEAMLHKFAVVVAIGGIGICCLVPACNVRQEADSSGAAIEEASEESTEAEGEVELDPEVQQELRLDFARVEPQVLDQLLQLTGVVEPDVRRVATVRPLTRGRLQAVAVTVGDRVVRGQTLARYDDLEVGDLLIQQAAATARLEGVEAEAEVKVAALKRAEHLVETGALSQGEKERREADYRRTQAEIRASRAELVEIKRKLSRLGQSPLSEGGERSQTPVQSPSLSPIVAPFDGVVTEVAGAVGDLVDPSSDLFQIVDLSRVWVQGQLRERDLGLIEVGQKAVVNFAAFPEKPFEGRITSIGDALDLESRTVQVRCEVANPRFELKLGLFAKLEISLPGGPEVLAVPAAALQQIDGLPVVFLRLSSDRFEKRAIRTGRSSAERVEVLEGLAAGDEVVTEGSFRLKSVLERGSLAEED